MIPGLLPALLSALSALSAAHAACMGAVAPEVLRAELFSVEAAWSALDPVSFHAKISHANESLACVEVPLKPADVAAIHRAEALDHALRSEDDRTVLDFRAVHEIDSAYTLPDRLAPPDHPLRSLFEKAKAAVPSPRSPLPSPASGWLVVDGARAVDAPTERPYVLQWEETEGKVGLTAHVGVGDALPAYPQPLPPAPEPVAAVPALGPLPLALIAGGAASLLGGGAMYMGVRNAATDNYPGLVDADQATYWEDDLKPRWMLSVVLVGLGVASAGAGSAMLFTGGASGSDATSE